MKKVISLIFILMSIVMLSSCTTINSTVFDGITSFANETEYTDDFLSLNHIFNVDEYVKLSSFEEMYAYDDKIDDYTKVSTEELYDAFTNHPAYNAFYYMWDSSNTSVLTYRSVCKSFDEFLKRPDSTTVLLEHKNELEKEEIYTVAHILLEKYEKRKQNYDQKVLGSDSYFSKPVSVEYSYLTEPRTLNEYKTTFILEEDDLVEVEYGIASFVSEESNLLLQKYSLGDIVNKSIDRRIVVNITDEKTDTISNQEYYYYSCENPVPYIVRIWSQKGYKYNCSLSTNDEGACVVLSKATS